jgi:predicted phosphodiesterase
LRAAILGDIHGNVFALQAVLADLRSQGPDALIVTGDLVYKYPWGAEVVDLLRSIPHQSILGNSELYLTLWATPLWPTTQWRLPLVLAAIEWERTRLGPARLAWLQRLPEFAVLSGGRLEDVLVVHGVPGNPFLPLLPAPGQERSPWVQTDQRVLGLLHGVDADVVIGGHTHTPMLRTIMRDEPERRALRILNPGAIGYGRGMEVAAGEASYLLLDWSSRGWEPTFRQVRYDPHPLYSALLALQEVYPLAPHMANQLRIAGTSPVPEMALDFLNYRWGDAPAWWEKRDQLAEWKLFREPET